MNDEEEYFVPLLDQQIFGAGIKRKRVTFVSARPNSQPSSRKSPVRPVGDKYLAIVLQNRSSQIQAVDCSVNDAQEAVSKADKPVCNICRLPMQQLNSSIPPQPHEASLVHQICVAHSHPPSNLNRSRRGLKYLSAYGWDPDSRLGLGASGTGIRAPIMGKVKNDTMGLGLQLSKQDSNAKASAEKNKKAEKLDAKKIRQMEQNLKMNSERWREVFYRSHDVETYLSSLE